LLAGVGVTGIIVAVLPQGERMNKGTIMTFNYSLGFQLGTRIFNGHIQGQYTDTNKIVVIALIVQS
jgi:hypothetical protein